MSNKLMENRQSRNKRTWLIVLIIVFLLGAVVLLLSDSSDNSSDNNQTETGSEEGALSEKVLRLSFENLPTLDETVATYELWIESDEGLKSYGKFSVGASGQVTIEASVSPQAIKEGGDVVVTVEQFEDKNPQQPASTIVFLGQVDQDRAQLDFNVDYQTAGGKYILGTPTDGQNSNETAGIWFVTPDGQEASLSLEELPDGWQYAGWVQYEGRYLGSGHFSRPDAADAFDGFSGPDPGPAFPGEDYLNNLPDGLEPPLDLTAGDSWVIVSLQPVSAEGDLADSTSGSRPYLPILSAEIPDDAQDHVLYDLSPAGSVPTGILVIEPVEGSGTL